MTKKLKKFFSDYNLIPVAILIFVITAIINPSFLKPFSITALLQDTAIFGFLVLGQALAVLTRGIDLSVGNMASMSSVVAAWLMVQLYGSMPDYIILILCIIIPVLFSTFLGFLSGSAISYLKIPALIATLGMMWIVTGIGYFFLRGVPTPYPISGFLKIFAGGFSFIPYSIIYFIIAAIILYFVLTKLRWGRYIYATGGNEYAAYISGVNTKVIKMSAYLFSGLFAGIAGLIVGAYSAVGYPRACDGYEFYAIAAIVMGGIALTGGEGNLWNAILGIFILRVLNKLVLFSGLSGYVEGMIIGSIVVIMLIIVTKKGETNISMVKIFKKRSLTSNKRIDGGAGNE